MMEVLGSLEQTLDWAFQTHPKITFDMEDSSLDNNLETLTRLYMLQGLPTYHEGEDGMALISERERHLSDLEFNHCGIFDEATLVTLLGLCLATASRWRSLSLTRKWDEYDDTTTIGDEAWMTGALLRQIRQNNPLGYPQTQYLRMYSTHSIAVLLDQRSLVLPVESFVYTPTFLSKSKIWS
ncbi:hypothetical protein SCHPADRAFT_893853 [Schizopora paradoxa]|uniref:Uncharacterized protein n=1 Tax=Schizopora paradoxa TaxID=27342 RepID=A0A0H2R9E9_9AGAM|nr:hypothetical protein SCHPADRAFT_893853 [Schizopora paradoxa]